MRRPVQWLALTLAFGLAGCNCGKAKTLAKAGECESGETRPCGPAPVGECHPGLQTCQDDRRWGACVGAQGPTSEVCDRKDNDCDGQVDNVAGSATALSQPCYTGPAGTEGVGLCQGGTQACTSGAWGACTGQVLPAPETCDGLDNDCDGQTDLSPDGGALTRGCYEGPSGTEGVGPCHGGSQACASGAWGACVGQALPGSETCNGADDDCNGQVDDGIAALPCYEGPAGTEGVGTCHGGARACTDGGFGACTGQVLPAAQDSCDGQDQNCDGQTNGACPCQPGDVVSCYRGPAGTAGVGPCHAGNQACGPDAGYLPCSGDVVPAAEACDGVDNDCDGRTDNVPGSATALTRSCYDGPASTRGVGACRDGTQTCADAGFGACVGQALPGSETCNGVDDDCDGFVDNAAAGAPAALTRACYDGPAGTRGVGACRDGAQTCSDGGFPTTCPGEVLPTAETCNGQDDDCNTLVDDGLATGAACSTGLKGVCAQGFLTCGDGGLVCVQAVQPSAEICDGLDNNCDGQVDEGFPDEDLDGYSACLDCDDHNAAIHPGAAEVCDGVDNNCDGQVDEGFDQDHDCYSTCGTAYLSHTLLADGGCDYRGPDGGGLDPKQADCDDGNRRVNPGVPCDCGAYDGTSCAATGDGVDNNCNGYKDETCACDPVDHDGDGYSQCQGDCDDRPDGGQAVHPGAPELCNGRDDDCNVATTENCDVGQPCGFDGGADTCKSRYLCVTDVVTGVASCGDLCNFSEAGAGVGDGCLAGTSCKANLIISDNDHVCTASGITSGKASGQACTADTECKSDSCRAVAGLSGKYCTDLCSSDAYCGAGAVCVLTDFPASPGLAYTEVYAGYCEPSGSSDVGAGALGATCRHRNRNPPDCRAGDLACFDPAGGANLRCSQTCCKQSDCPSGYYCGQGPAKAVGATGFADGGSHLVDTGAPACLPAPAGHGANLAGQACAASGECASGLCDVAVLGGVCLDFCCSDASCPQGYLCELTEVQKANGHVEQMRICLAPPARPLYILAP